jgi:hypothetical protein
MLRLDYTVCSNHVGGGFVGDLRVSALEQRSRWTERLGWAQSRRGDLSVGRSHWLKADIGKQDILLAVPLLIDLGACGCLIIPTIAVRSSSVLTTAVELLFDVATSDVAAPDSEPKVNVIVSRCSFVQAVSVDVELHTLMLHGRLFWHDRIVAVFGSSE